MAGKPRRIGGETACRSRKALVIAMIPGLINPSSKVSLLAAGGGRREGRRSGPLLKEEEGYPRLGEDYASRVHHRYEIVRPLVKSEHRAKT